jgi:hypothetical protein
MLAFQIVFQGFVALIAIAGVVGLVAGALGGS